MIGGMNMRDQSIPAACPRCAARVIRVVREGHGFCSDHETIKIEGGGATLGGGRKCNLLRWVCLHCSPEWAEVHRLAWQDNEWQMAKEQSIVALDFELARQFRDRQYEIRRPLRELVAMLLNRPPDVP
jgi:hypothetical protein